MSAAERIEDEEVETSRAIGGGGWKDAPPVAPVASEADWPEPLAFRDETPRPVPTKHLPLSMREFVDALSESVQVSADVPALAVLGVASGAVASKVSIRLRSDRVEAVNLWTASVLGSGERKSAVFSAATAPLAEWEREHAAELAPLVERDRQRFATLEARLKSAVRRAATAEPDDAGAAADERDQLAQELAAFRGVETFQLILGDVTPEAVAAVLAGQGGRAAIVTDEAATLFDIARGRYAKDGRSNLDVLLQSYSGSPVRVNRVGRPPVCLPRPCLTVATTMQPRVLEDVGSSREMTERGLLPRFLWALASSRVGFRDVDTSPMSDAIRDRYGAVVRRLCELPEVRDDDRQIVAAVIDVEPEAVRVLNDFAREIERELRPGGKFEHVREWANRIEGNAARVAALLHLWKLAEAAVDLCDPLALPPSPVTIEAVESAAALSREFFIPHGLAAFARMGADPAVSGARRILAWIQRTGTATFSRREAHRGNESWTDRASDLDEPLRILGEREFIRPSLASAPVGSRGGHPPGPTWDVNPRAFAPGQNRQNRQNTAARP